jgi:hypothetical protein
VVSDQMWYFLVSCAVFVVFVAMVEWYCDM